MVTPSLHFKSVLLWMPAQILEQSLFLYFTHFSWIANPGSTIYISFWWTLQKVMVPKMWWLVFHEMDKVCSVVFCWVMQWNHPQGLFPIWGRDQWGEWRETSLWGQEVLQVPGGGCRGGERRTGGRSRGKSSSRLTKKLCWRFRNIWPGINHFSFRFVAKSW